MAPEYFVIPAFFLIIVFLLVVNIKHERKNKKLEHQLAESSRNIIKQSSVITLLKDNRCGKHVFDIDDKVIPMHIANSLSHNVNEINIRRKRDTMYKITLGGSAMWVPEHVLKKYEPKKEEPKEGQDDNPN